MEKFLEFKKNPKLTVGVELELQLINLATYNLTLESEDFLRRIVDGPYEENIKPEISQSMIEINSSIHNNYNELLHELTSIQESVLTVAKKMHIGVCGGGTHPFQKWKGQKTFPAERFLSFSEQYGYLAKQFTVFGQHIHISCLNGNDALYLCHAFAYYMPHFIALSASSPFHQGEDTSFDCSRLSAINAFPLSGTPPWFFEWQEFIAYFEKLYELKVVKIMKDFYWDIRPKPEYGTVEIRICDTPLTLKKACDLAFYAYNLAAYLLDNKQRISRDIYLVYLINRFRAMRYGLGAQIIDVGNETHKILKDDILHTCYQIEKYALASESLECIERIRESTLNGSNDAKWLRDIYSKYYMLEDVVRYQTEVWQL